MPKNRLLLICLLFLFAGLSTVFLSPFFISGSLRLWLRGQAHRQGLSVELGKIDAPFLRPVTIERIHITNPHGSKLDAELSVDHAIVDFAFARILTGARGGAIRSLSIEAVRAEVHRTFPEQATASRLDWSTWQKLLPENFNFHHLDLRIENGSTIVLLRNASLSGSEIEAGRFSAGELTIGSPWFRQTFAGLRGATKWQDNRLTIGGVTLTRGLDLQSMTTDFSRLAKRRSDVQFDLDAFGGKIRASLSNEWRPQNSTWNIAGAATGISLAQTSEAIGFTDRLGGSVRACNFTFRGDPRGATEATASIWAEIIGLSWRDRSADVIMLGAVLYNRQIQLEELFVKQHKNELTMSGEGSLPSKSADWLSPDFRGDISGSITELGQFARLFGAEPGDFAGAIAINGTMNTRDRKIGGHLTATGNSLSIFKTQIDNLTIKLSLKPTEFELEQLEINRKKDFLRTHGKIELGHDHNYSGSLNAAVSNLSEYLSIFRGPEGTPSKPISAETQITVDSGSWDAHGILNMADSRSLNIAAKFALKFGQDWKASPLEMTVDFPAIFLANAPQFFHPEIFKDGILSGKVVLSETLQHPRIAGDVQLLSAQLQNAPIDLMQASARLTFNGDRAAIDFFNAGTKDIDLSFRGEIDFRDSNDLVAKIFPSTPVFDLMNAPIQCASEIKLAPVGITLAPMIDELDLHGGFFGRGWTIGLGEAGETQTPAAAARTTREFPLCFSGGSAEKTLTLGLHPRAKPEAARPKKRAKRR